MTEGPGGLFDEETARYVERLALVIRGAGIQRMAARVFAALLVSDDGALGAGDLGRLLGVSPGAISTAVRYLEQAEMVVRTRVPGDRRDLYALPSMDYDLMFGRDRLIKEWRDVVDEGVATMGPDTTAGERLAHFRALLDFVRSEMQASGERWQDITAPGRGEAPPK